MAASRESQVYHDLVRFKPAALSLNAWAVAAGVSRTVWADMRRHGNPSRRTLEKLLSAAGSSLAEFEALRLGAEPRPSFGVPNRLGDPSQTWNPTAAAPLPLIESSLAGEWGGARGEAELTQVRRGAALDSVHRPPSLAFDPDAYALTIVGDSMRPRFRPGTRIAVSPRSPVSVGDDVLVRLRPDRLSKGVERVIIGQLVRRTSNTVELRQFNPDVTFEVEAEQLDAIFKIAGELI